MPKQTVSQTRRAYWMLEGSHGYVVDANKAVELLITKAREGDSDAMWILSYCFQFGIGVEKNIEASKKLARKANALQNPVAKIMDKLFFIVDHNEQLQGGQKMKSSISP